MSSVFKSSEKRSRSSTRESNSFVKNVTSRVSGLLPATITKWFSSSSSSSANGSAPTVDISDSSTEDEAPETQPPTKRMRFTSPGTKYNAESPALNTEETKDVSTSVLYNSIQTTPGKNNFRRDTGFFPAQYKPNEESKLERTDTSFKHNVTTNVQSVAQKRKSIFDLPNRNEDPRKTPSKTPTTSTPMSEPKKPCFKPSLLGSPFYPGRTVYGGTSSTYINQPYIKQCKVTHSNEPNTNESLNMSSSARCVLDLLENYSSPLLDARRIQQVTKRSKLDESIDSTIAVPSSSNSFNYKNQELHVPSIASILRLKSKSRLMDTTKIARQIIASHSSTLSSFQPYVDVSNREKSNKNTEKSQGTSKLKSRLTRPNRDEDCYEIPETVQLPTAVLQIDTNNLPKFSFGEGSLTQQPISKTTFTQTPMITAFSEPGSLKMSMSSKSTATEPKPMNEMFKFSTPVKLSLDSQQNDSSPPNFVFGSPESNVDKPNYSDDTDKPTLSLTPKKMDTLLAKPSGFTFGMTNKVDSHEKKVEEVKKDKTLFNNIGIQPVSNKTDISKWKCEDCWVSNDSNKDKCICCGSCKPTKSKAPEPSKVIEVPVSKDWKCGDCWVSNASNVDKCVCCGGRKPDKTCAPEATKAASEQAPKDWKCDDCWITNKNSVDKCAACGGAKPGIKSADAAPSQNSSLSSSFNKPSNQFADIMKSQKANNKWECPTCLVSNDNETTTCVCCGTEKNGKDKESMKNLFNFNTNGNPKFKFGLDPKMQESNIQKKLEESTKPASKPLEESETNNNIVPKSPAFTFTAAAKLGGDKPDESKIPAAPIPTFTFGIPKQNSLETVKPVAATGFKLPEPAKLSPQKEEKEKVQEVPKIDFKLPQVTDPVKTTGFFTPPSSLGNLTQNKVTPTFGSLVNSSSEKKSVEAPKSMLPVDSTDNMQSEKPASTSTFTFSASGIKPGIGIFNMPANTAAVPAPTTTGLTFEAPKQTAPTTTTASTLSLFQKPETGSCTGLSMFQPKIVSGTSIATNLFQKAETTSAPTTTATPAAPLFSFVSNTTHQDPSVAAEKPKFNFTFGSNSNTEGTSMFKPAFGTITDNNTNKFSLSSGNNLSGNKLGGNNGLSASNALGGTTTGIGSNMTGNALSSNNEMTSNDMGSSGMQTANTLTMGNSLFGQNIQKENNNMWSNNTNTNNVFGSNNSTNNLQKPPFFTFGASTPFNAGNAASNSQPTPNLFNSNPQPAQNVFGMPAQNSTSQPSLFPSQPQSQPTSNIFGSAQANTNTSTTALGMFGTPNVGATSTFGTPNTPINNFEAPLTSTPAPAFNFGAPQTPVVFGFGQNPSGQPAQAGVYNFGGSTPGAPQQLQFNMGSAPAVRRVRKAVRRNTPR